MFFVYGVYNNSLEMMFIRLGLLTRKVSGMKQSYRKGVLGKNNIISIVYENSIFSSFIYSRRGIYGILHILILLMSLFLVISISIDTFHNIPFLNQGSYLKIQFWICMFFLFDFLLEFFLSKEKGRYFTSHFIFLLVSIPYLNIIDFYHITFSPEISYFLRFIPLLRGGYALAIVVGWLSGSKASGLFTSYITMLMAPCILPALSFLCWNIR